MSTDKLSAEQEAERRYPFRKVEGTRVPLTEWNKEAIQKQHDFIAGANWYRDTVANEDHTRDSLMNEWGNDTDGSDPFDWLLKNFSITRKQPSEEYEYKELCNCEVSNLKGVPMMCIICSGKKRVAFLKEKK